MDELLWLVPAFLLALSVFTRLRVHRAERLFPPEGKFVSVNGVMLHYLERGEEGGQPGDRVHICPRSGTNERELGPDLNPDRACRGRKRSVFDPGSQLQAASGSPSCPIGRASGSGAYDSPSPSGRGDEGGRATAAHLPVELEWGIVHDLFKFGC